MTEVRAQFMTQFFFLHASYCSFIIRFYIFYTFLHIFTLVTSSFLFLCLYSLIFYRDHSKLDHDRSTVETFFTIDFCHKVGSTKINK